MKKIIFILLLILTGFIAFQRNIFFEEEGNLACEFTEEKDGPWQNNLVLVRLDQEEETVSSQKTIIRRAGVPSIIEDEEGRLILVFQWFPCEEEFDKIAVSFSENNGKTWSDPEPIEIENFPEGKRAFDPTLVLLEDGRFRLYFTVQDKSDMKGGGQMQIYSAISEDALHYSLEDGVRLELTDKSLFDAAVAYFKGEWHMILPKNEGGPSGDAYHATSADGLNFEMQEAIHLMGNVNWTGNLFAQDDVLYFYGTPMWFTSTEDGEHWEKAQPIQNGEMGDPTAVCLEEGQCIVIGVSKPK